MKENFFSKLIRGICDGDLAQTDKLARALREKLTIADMEKCAELANDHE